MKNKKYFQIALYVFLTFAACFLFYTAVVSGQTISNVLAFWGGLLSPFVVGFGIAYVVNFIMRFCEGRLGRIKSLSASKALRPLSLISAYLILLIGLALVVMLVLQTYALGFNFATVGEWVKFWFDNTFNVLRANTSVGMIALGMTLVIITGGIDLAVGSTVAGVGTVLMAMIDTGEHGVLVKFGITGVPAFIIGIIVALVVGMGIGAVIGALVTKGRIPPFIVTLGVMNVVRSVSQYFTKSYTPTVPKEFEAIANTVIFGQRPMTILYWLVLAVIFYLVMKHTAFGRYVYAVGSNERTSRLSGINTDKVKMKVYMISGLVVDIASVTQLSRLGGMDVASAGSGYDMDAIAAVVVGGTAMSGGRGSIIGTVLGVLIIGIMNNLLILLGVDSFLTDAFKGAIVVAAVLMQRKDSNN